LIMSSRPSSPRGRRFYSKSGHFKEDQHDDNEEAKGVHIADLVNRSIVGRNARFKGPFGVKKIVYCDHVASGRAVSFIEDFIRDQVKNQTIG